MITLWAATDPGFTTIGEGAAVIGNAIRAFAVPLVLLVTGGQLVIGAIAGRLTLSKVISTVGVGGSVAGLIWMTPSLMTAMQTTYFGPESPTDATPSPTTPATPATPETAPAAPGQPTDWTWALQALVVLAILAAVIGIGLTAWMVLSRHRTTRRAHAHTRDAQRQRWANGVVALDLTSERLMEFESDAEAVYFTRPLLADVDEPATARFYTAYAEARALHTESVPTDDELIAAFVTAAAAAARAFGLADENARRKGRIGIVHGGRPLTGGEKRKVAQARKLLAQALDPASTPELAHTAQSKAQSILDEVGLIIPERLTAKVTRSIEALHKPALSAGTPAAATAQ